MSKPYNTQAENIIWIINEQGPINAKAIARIIGKNQKQISNIISTVCTALADVVKKEPIKKDGKVLKGYMYSFTRSLIVPEAYEQYKQFVNDRKKKKEVKADFDKTIGLGRNRDALQATNGLKEQMEDYLSKAIGVTVKIEGEIKLLFGFVKE